MLDGSSCGGRVDENAGRFDSCVFGGAEGCGFCAVVPSPGAAIRELARNRTQQWRAAVLQRDPRSIKRYPRMVQVKAVDAVSVLRNAFDCVFHLACCERRELDDICAALRCSAGADIATWRDCACIDNYTINGACDLPGVSPALAQIPRNLEPRDLRVCWRGKCPSSSSAECRVARRLQHIVDADARIRPGRRTAQGRR